MELLKPEEDLDLHFDLNDNKFVTNNMCCNNDNNVNLNKTIDKTLFNNINTNVTFDTELKPTYTINETSKQYKGQYLDNKTGVVETICDQNINNTGESNVLSKNNHNTEKINKLPDENETDILINSKHINANASTDVNTSITDSISSVHIRKEELSTCKQGDVNDNTDVNENNCCHSTEINETIKSLDIVDKPNVDNINNCTLETKSEDKECEKIPGDDNLLKRKIVESPINNLLSDSKNELVHESTRSNPKSNDSPKTPEPAKQEYVTVRSNTINDECNERSRNEFSKNVHENRCTSSRSNDQSKLTTSKSMDTIQRPFTHDNEIQKLGPQQLYSPQEPCMRITEQVKSNGRHNKFLNTLRQMNEQKKQQRQELDFLNRRKARHVQDAYKKPRNMATFEDDESPLHTINYAADKFDDAYLSGYQDRVNKISRISPGESRSSAGCSSSTGKQNGGHRNSSRKPSRSSAMRTTDGKENNHSSFDVYNIETSLPHIDLEAIECHLRAATKEERRFFLIPIEGLPKIVDILL
ncbi:hypothetical protein WDU94_008604 [Cyamophila willieti]